MDYRTKNFQDKFASASTVLGVPPTEIMSVKLRDMVKSDSEYSAFFHELEHRYRFRVTPVQGEFQDGPRGSGRSQGVRLLYSRSFAVQAVEAA